MTLTVKYWSCLCSKFTRMTCSHEKSSVMIKRLGKVGIIYTHRLKKKTTCSYKDSNILGSTTVINWCPRLTGVLFLSPPCRIALNE